MMSALEYLNVTNFQFLSTAILFVYPFCISLVLALLARFGLLGVDAELYWSECFAVCVGFGMLSLTSGLVMSLSREASVSSVVPAALTLIGGIALYFVKEAGSRTVVVALAMSSFSFFFLFGTFSGISLRVNAEKSAALGKYDLETQISKAELEFQINTERRARGLDPIDFNK